MERQQTKIKKISSTFANFFCKGVFSCNKKQKTAVKWSVRTNKYQEINTEYETIKHNQTGNEP